MMPDRFSRRALLGTGAKAAAVAGLGGIPVAYGQEANEADPPEMHWRLALNASTIRPAAMEEKVRVAAEAGYDGIELWSDEMTRYAEGGGSLRDLGQRIADAGLQVPNIIGIWNWMPQDDAERPAAWEAARRQLDQAAQVKAQHIAAVPTPDRDSIDTLWAAERYRELMALGDEFGITVAFEFVGFLRGVHRLGQAAAIAIEARRRDACLVADTFHLYRGGSGFEGVRHLSGAFYAVFHFNDAPADPPQFEQGDEHRLLPGDGVLPLAQLLRDLREIRFSGVLSLELFNRALWERPPLEVARTGIERMRQLIAASEA